ncbi:hypothetical protein FQA47_001488 [Oryzias melastigma]|uniref:Uncharacterized protein n=1 Tax=Oryzias melastigma TaxID=30732 RepID=A0A834FRL5_ORYME|nr:hypothetical protein FQA47_001488 [Oryzias melastigma]
MAKGKTKISSRSEDSAPPPARSLRSRKREAESNDVGQTANVQAPLHLKGVEEVTTAAKPLQECAVIVHQLCQSVEQSCLTRPDEATKEKPTDESEVSFLSTAAPKSSSSCNENQAESWADPQNRCSPIRSRISEVSEASSTSVEKEVEGQQEQQESAPAFPAKKRRRMGSCGLTEGERSRILGNSEKKPSRVKDSEMKLQQAELQAADAAELQQAELKQAELQQAELKKAELQQAELQQQEELQQAELKKAELQHADENRRAPTEPPISSLYRADPDSESAPQSTQREHSEGPEENIRLDGEEDAPPQTVNAEEGTSSTEAPTTGHRCGSVEPPTEIPADSEETCNGGSTDAPAAALGSGRDSHSTHGCSDDVSDSQLNTIVFTEELMEDQYCLEDASELLCGIISELSSINRRVMAAHRELEKLRRSRKASRYSAH